jgi:hypothetical protein
MKLAFVAREDQAKMAWLGGAPGPRPDVPAWADPPYKEANSSTSTSSASGQNQRNGTRGSLARHGRHNKHQWFYVALRFL